jgi:hypothetical protein
MDRFEQLKSKGWVNLSMDEKDEYSKLKKAFDAVPKIEKEEPKEETVTFTKSALKEMLDQIKQETKANTLILKDNEWKEYKPGPKRRYTCTIKVYRQDSESEPGLIVDWKRFKTDRNPETKKLDYDIYNVTIRYDSGKEEIIQIPVIEFNGFQEVEVCEIIEVREKKLQKSYGRVRVSKKVMDDLGNEIIMDEKTEGSVDQVVVKDDPTFIIKRPNGKTMEIKADRVNQ